MQIMLEKGLFRLDESSKAYVYTPANVKSKIFDTRGQERTTFIYALQNAGEYSVVCNGADDSSKPVFRECIFIRLLQMK